MFHNRFAHAAERRNVSKQCMHFAYYAGCSVRQPQVSRSPARLRGPDHVLFAALRAKVRGTTPPGIMSSPRPLSVPYQRFVVPAGQASSQNAFPRGSVDSHPTVLNIELRQALPDAQPSIGSQLYRQHKHRQPVIHATQAQATSSTSSPSTRSPSAGN